MHYVMNLQVIITCNLHNEHMVNQPPYHEVYIINVNKWRVDPLDMTAHHIFMYTFWFP